MRFSATASFTPDVRLLGMGTLTPRATRSLRELPFAADVLPAFPVVSRPTGQHVEYESPHFLAAAVMTLYLVSTTVSPLLSTHRVVKVFGTFALLSFGAAYYFYARWFISVWCFFAALLSIVIYVHFAAQPARGATPPPEILEKRT